MRLKNDGMKPGRRITEQPYGACLTLDHLGLGHASYGTTGCGAFPIKNMARPGSNRLCLNIM